MKRRKVVMMTAEEEEDDEEEDTYVTEHVYVCHSPYWPGGLDKINVFDLWQDLGL
jgi:hypothetical protein